MRILRKCILRITGLICLIHFTSCEDYRSEELMLQIVNVAFENTYNKNLDETYFYLDTVPQVTNIDLSLEGLRSSSKDEVYLNQIKKFEDEVVYSSGKNWLDLVNKKETYKVGFNDNDESLSGYFLVTEPVLVDKNKIWVYFELFCGNVCSKGLLIEVIKVNGKWEQLNLTQVWG